MKEDVKVWRRNWLLRKRCDSRYGFPEEDPKVWYKKQLLGRKAW
jgi:hypothetical protein